MPFDKRYVTETKINKQIRNIKKQVDELVRTRPSDHRDVVTGGNKVADVQKALESLMNQWQREAKSNTSPTTTDDPFASLKERMNERLQVLVDFYEEHTTQVKPSWMQQMEDAEKTAKEQKELSKLSTRELEERERKQEREKVLAAMQEKKEMAKEKMEQLRKLRELKRKATSPTNPTEGATESAATAAEQPNTKKAKTKTTRRVRWRDGVDRSDTVDYKNRLEQVFVYSYEPKEASTALDEDDDMDGIPLAEDDDVDEDLWT